MVLTRRQFNQQLIANNSLEQTMSESFQEQITKANDAAKGIIELKDKTNAVGFYRSVQHFYETFIKLDKLDTTTFKHMVFGKIKHQVIISMWEVHIQPITNIELIVPKLKEIMMNIHMDTDTPKPTKETEFAKLFSSDIQQEIKAGTIATNDFQERFFAFQCNTDSDFKAAYKFILGEFNLAPNTPSLKEKFALATTDAYKLNMVEDLVERHLKNWCWKCRSKHSKQECGNKDFKSKPYNNRNNNKKKKENQSGNNNKGFNNNQKGSYNGIKKEPTVRRNKEGTDSESSEDERVSGQGKE